MAKLNQIICLDFETGGLKAKKNPITSVAYQAFELDSYKHILEFSTFVQPYGNLEIDQKALDYSSITYEDLASGIDYKQVVKQMQDDFSKANLTNSHMSKPILLGHNISFDIGFLLMLFGLCKVDITKYLDCGEDHLGNPTPKYYDTLLLSKQKWGNDPTMPNYKLGTCVDKAGLALFDAHNAMNDVRATKELFFYLTNNMRTGSDTSEESKAIRYRNHYQFSTT